MRVRALSVAGRGTDTKGWRPFPLPAVLSFLVSPFIFFSFFRFLRSFLFLHSFTHLLITLSHTQKFLFIAVRGAQSLKP